ncbi:hypothetical protein [Bradyrhizobium sp. USDA 4350]
MRLAALNALAGADANSGPTIARNRVYDSRISDFDPETYPNDAQPTIIILTDDDEGEQLSKQNGGPPFRRNIDLVFELAMVMKVKVGTTFTLGYPDTDARLEAALDVLEFQIAQRLGYDPAPAAVLFRKYVRPHKHESHRQVMDDAGVKIAARLVTWNCEITDDQISVFNASGTVPTGLDALPEPLKSIAAALPAGSSGADICAAIIAALTALTAPQLEGVDATFDADPNQQAPTVVQTLNFPPTN